MSALVDVATARRGMAALVDEGLGDEEIQRAYAHAVWSTLVEPGDGVAGALIEALGVVRALELALSETSERAATSEIGLDDRELRAGYARWQPRRGDAVSAFDAARRAGARLLTPDDAAWPVAVRDLGVHAPLCLWVRGDTGILRTPAAVALVGARAATAYGTHVASQIAAECAADGILVVSGAAYGIDGAAHRGALHAAGPTIAVLAGGVDRPYPAGHGDLISQIAHSGTVIAEVPCGSAPTKWRFLARNRVIAALSGATVVVEAAQRSGALNTAYHAASLGRPLGAVPGPVTSAASAGCHRLMREADAVCVTGSADVRELLGYGPESDPIPGAEDAARTDGTTRIMDALSARTPRTTDEVARRSGFSPADAGGVLGLLELDGRVERAPTGWTRRSTASPPRLW